jgi:hypothetical protein
MDTAGCTATNTTKLSRSSIYDTFSESGTINSLIYLSSDNNKSTLGAAKKFILFGDWSLIGGYYHYPES